MIGLPLNTTAVRPSGHWRLEIIVGVSIFALFISGSLWYSGWMPEDATSEALLRHSSALRLRNATVDDLDDIVRIVWAGFPDDPEIDYRFPLRKAYPDDYRYWTRQEYQRYIEQPTKYTVHLVEDTKPIALAVWDIDVMTQANGTDLGLDRRRDANTAHCTAFQDATAKCFDDHFSKYAEKQVNLWLLVTHPDARRRGAGTMLVNWGLNNTKQWPVTVIASPMGELLYAHLGFEVKDRIPIQVKGEAEKLIEAAMERHTTR